MLAPKLLRVAFACSVLAVVAQAASPKRPATVKLKKLPKNRTSSGPTAANATTGALALSSSTKRASALLALFHACIFMPQACSRVLNAVLGGRGAGVARLFDGAARAGDEENSFIDYRAPGAEGGVGWDDVVGAESAVRELRRLIDVVGSREAATRARRCGASAPRNILLVGPPGTGKTLLARAAAESLDAPLLVVSGSEMVKGKYAGVGVERVRQLFSAARRAAAAAKRRAALVFIDEIDSCGRARGGDSSAVGADHDNTLNQLLVELDGFGARDDGAPLVVVLAATNRATSLDAALLRKGRFDKIVELRAPDLEGRRKLFDHYVEKQLKAAAARELSVDAGGATALVRVVEAANGTLACKAVAPKCAAGHRFRATLHNDTLATTAATAAALGCRRAPLRDGADARRLAFTVAHAGAAPEADDAALPADLAGLSPGLVGADVHAVVNEAALGAMADGRYVATRADYLRAVEDVLLGKPLEDDLDGARESPDWRVAVHEAGHVLASFVLEGVDDAIRASVRPRAGGSLGVTLLGADDAKSVTRAQLRDRLVLLLAGRAAESHVFRGDVSSGPSDDLMKTAELAKAIVVDFGMSDLGAAAAVGDADDAVRAELRRAEDAARDLVRDHDRTLRSVARALVKRETLDGAALGALFAEDGAPRAPERVAAALG